MVVIVIAVTVDHSFTSFSVSSLFCAHSSLLRYNYIVRIRISCSTEVLTLNFSWEKKKFGFLILLFALNLCLGVNTVPVQPWRIPNMVVRVECEFRLHFD